MEHKKIHFKYHPNIYDLDILREAEDGSYPICQCCGQETKFSSQTMYSRERVDYICPECIANGDAAKKFNGQFVQSAEDFKVNDENKRQELYYRTPGYISWQGEYWLACCEDYCAYVGEVGTKELEEMGIADEVFAEYESRDYGYDDVRAYLVKAGSMAGYLFQCLHCKKYHLWVDAD